MTAALGVIMDTNTRNQKYFGGGEEISGGNKQIIKGQYGHSDDILALAISADRTKVVTGQLGTEPMIFVWDAFTGLRLHFMTLPRGSRAVSALAFNKDSSLVAAVDMKDNNCLHIFDLNAPKVKDKALLKCSGD
jgi:microtubule-associated protein-like 6